MSSTAKQRIQALGNQISPPKTPSTADSFEGIPTIKKVAGMSAAPRVAGKVVIVTGANSILGIGRASAHQFAENGARAVYICDYDDTNLATHKREIESLYPAVDVHVHKFDAADEKAVKAVVDHAINTYGRLDVFFANAGIVGKYAMFADFEKDEFMKVFDTNVARYASPTSNCVRRLAIRCTFLTLVVQPQCLPSCQIRRPRDAKDLRIQAHALRKYHWDRVRRGPTLQRRHHPVRRVEGGRRVARADNRVPTRGYRDPR